MKEKKELKFTELYISNFRNITEQKIKFNDGITTIKGENGLGKTNTLSAITWCLFGKDVYDAKQFPISPIVDGIEDNNLTTIARLIINDNYVIERSWYQRKATIKTGWIIDGKVELVSLTQSKFNDELKENLVDEETFKSLSNINYIPNLNWKDLKKLIFDLIGEISDDEVLLRDDFSLIEDYVKKFGIDETQRLLKDTEIKLNTDIKRLETEYQTLLSTKEKYVVTDEDNEELLKRKNEIKISLDNAEKQIKKERETTNLIAQKQKELAQIENEISRINMIINDYETRIKDYNELYNQSGITEEQLREKDKKDLEMVISNLETSKKELENKIEISEHDLGKLKDEGETLKRKEIKIENDTCSSCGQKLPVEKIESILEKMKQQQMSQLLDVKNKFDELKETIISLGNEKEKCLKLLDDKKEELISLDTKKYDILDETQRQKEIRVRREQLELELEQSKNILPKFLEEQQAINKELEEIKLQKEIETLDVTPLNAELEEINTKLATTITLNKLNEDVKNKQEELETSRSNKLTNKEKLQEVIKFNNVKADLLQKRVKQYFNNVNFKTKEFTQNGEEVETFKICNENGVEFKDINTGHKILLGIDLLQGIMKAKNIYVPMIIDNFECLTNEINLNGIQLIVAKAEKNVKNLEVA